MQDHILFIIIILQPVYSKFVNCSQSFTINNFFVVFHQFFLGASHFFLKSSMPILKGLSHPKTYQAQKIAMLFSKNLEYFVEICFSIDFQTLKAIKNY